MVDRNVATKSKQRKKSAKKSNGKAQKAETAALSEEVKAGIDANLAAHALEKARRDGAREALQRVANQYGRAVKILGKDGSVETIEPAPMVEQANQDIRNARREETRRWRKAFGVKVVAPGASAQGLREALGQHIFATYEDDDGSLLVQVLHSLVDDLEILGNGVRGGTLQGSALERQLWRLEHRARFGLLVAGDNDDAADAEEAAEEDAEKAESEAAS